MAELDVAAGPVAAGTPLRNITDLPGPRALPLLGNLHQLKVSKIATILEGWADRYGPMYQLRLSGKPVLVVSNAEIVGSVFRQRPDTFRRIGVTEPIFDELNMRGVFSAEGDDWRRLRRLTMQGLNAEYLKQYFDVVVLATRRLHARWSEAAAAGQDIDVQADLMRYTLDVTTELTMGVELDTLVSDGDPLQERLSRLLPTVGKRHFAVVPYWRYIKILPAVRQIDDDARAIRGTVHEIIAAARKRRAGSTAPPANILEAMLLPGEDEQPFTEDELAGSVLTMLVAGQETTASAVAWVINAMLEHPQVQERMCAEAVEVLGTDPTAVTFAQNVQLPYTEAVINETMRLWPISRNMYYEANVDTVLGDVAVPAGAVVFVLTAYESTRGRFVDGTTFRPERWLRDGQPARGAGHDTRSFIPFGAGPRFCPGRNLALLEARMVLAMATRTWKLTRPPVAPPVDSYEAFACQPAGLVARLTARA